jgi:hypothetical protein
MDSSFNLGSTGPHLLRISKDKSNTGIEVYIQQLGHRLFSFFFTKNSKGNPCCGCFRFDLLDECLIFKLP